MIRQTEILLPFAILPVHLQRLHQHRQIPPGQAPYLQLAIHPAANFVHARVALPAHARARDQVRNSDSQVAALAAEYVLLDTRGGDHGGEGQVEAVGYFGQRWS